MTLIIQKPTGAKLNLRKTWQPMDPDAAAYITAVETADGQSLEEKTKIAIDNFVLGCKADGIWSAIKASCILAGARTLEGALVPLVGAAPTNNNFVSGDYNRETGLRGDGSTKYLNSNRNNNADPQNSQHGSIYVTTAGNQAVSQAYMGTRPPTVNDNHLTIGIDTGSVYFRSRTPTPAFTGASSILGLIGVSRSTSAAYTARRGGSSSSVTSLSGTPYNQLIAVFSNPSVNYSDARLAFYSIGESLDLALLDARVTDLINAFGAAIP
jgi:hypothetical protein